MANKPLSVAAYLQEGLPQEKINSGIPLKNRFKVFEKDRDRSLSSVRGCSPLKKRKLSEGGGEEEDEVGVVSQDRNKAFLSMADEAATFKKMRDIASKLEAELGSAADSEVPPKLKEILGGIVEWMRLASGVQETTASVVVDSMNKVLSPGRKARKDDWIAKDCQGGMENRKKLEDDSAQAERKKKFVLEVKEAERSMLIFRTDMGKVPVMNCETMRKRFTMDLTAKAAQVENKVDGKPSVATVQQLDDTLSMVTRMEYFGKVTKRSVRFDEDRRKVEEDFFTVPVKISFKDKNTREAAESRLRGLCGTRSTIPYHRTLRAAINNIVKESKEKYPRSFIQVKVEADKFRVTVNRREEGVWYDGVEVVPLPDSVLDTSREAGRPGKPGSQSTDAEDVQMQG